MRKFWHYLGNITGIIVALILYSRLEIFYFAPQRIHLGNLRVIVTALITAFNPGQSPPPDSNAILFMSAITTPP